MSSGLIHLSFFIVFACFALSKVIAEFHEYSRQFSPPQAIFCYLVVSKEKKPISTA